MGGRAPRNGGWQRPSATTCKGERVWGGGLHWAVVGERAHQQWWGAGAFDTYVYRAGGLQWAVVGAGPIQ